MPTHSRRRVHSAQPTIGAFLRSINVQLDAESPARIAHFQPTAKAVTLLEKLCLGKAPALLVTAPYGSGKSLAATYALHVTENVKSATPTLSEIAPRLTPVSAKLGLFVTRRARSSQRGVTIALQGHAADLRRALCDAFHASVGRQGSPRAVAGKLSAHLRSECSVVVTTRFLLELGAQLGFDQVMILWDEFGRHLESLIASGRTAELHDIQQLAELTARGGVIPLRLCVLLHQGFAAYSASAPESVRREWRKVEERFERLDYVDDSRELLRLIVALASTLRPTDTAVPPKREFDAYAKALKAHGLFKDFGQQEVVDMLVGVHPLDGVALSILPRLSARVAQNERTLFNFLQAADWSQPMGADALYRYFEPAMRQDVGAGGTYRAALSTASALCKCLDEEEVRALQATCGLTVSLAGKHTKISRQLLIDSLQRSTPTANGAERTVDALIERKLLLYRRHSDEVSVWQGTDANLRERAAEARVALSATFDLEAFLANEWPLPAIRATEHNDKFRIRRSFGRQYRQSTELLAPSIDQSIAAVLCDLDGLIIHTLPLGQGADRASVHAAAQRLSSQFGGRVIISVPLEPVPLGEAALDLAAVMHLQQDRFLLDEDPLVGDELRQMEDDARRHMLRLIERVTTPNGLLRYHARGKGCELGSTGALRRAVSALCTSAFPKTPTLPNEQVNRRRPTAVIVNARKKLIAAVLEGAGKPELGFGDPEFQRELGATVLAQFRAIVLRTGLYREFTSGRWGFAAPGMIDDRGLRTVWEELRRFFTVPSENPKEVSELVRALASPPYGVRAGVIPILIACAIRAFPVAGSLTCDGQYVVDVRPSTIEELCKEPNRFALHVLAMEDEQREYLEGICELFKGSRAAAIDDPDLIRRAFEWIQHWKHDAPDAVRLAGGLSARASAARKVLWSTEDPVTVLLRQLPIALGTAPSDLTQATRALHEVKGELEAVVARYTAIALRTMASAVGIGLGDRSPLEVLAGLREWAEAIPEGALDSSADPRTKGVVAQLAQPDQNIERFAATITARLTKSVTRWDDSEPARFQQEFRRVVEGAEEAAIRLAGATDGSPREGSAPLAALFERRVAAQIASLASLVGEGEAQRRVQRLLGTHNSRKGTAHHG